MAGSGGGGCYEGGRTGARWEGGGGEAEAEEGGEGVGASRATSSWPISRAPLLLLLLPGLPYTLSLFSLTGGDVSQVREQYSTFSSVPTATKQTPFLSLLSVQCYTFLSVSINVHGAGSDRSSLPRPSPSTIARRIVSSSEEGLAFPSPSSFARGGRAVAVSVASRSLSLSLSPPSSFLYSPSSPFLFRPPPLLFFLSLLV